MEDDDLDLEALLERSRRQFVEGFPAEFAQLTALADTAATGDESALASLRLAAHQLVGRAGILQFMPLAKHAAALQTVARVDQARHFDPGAAAACLTAMRNAFADACSASAASSGQAAARLLILVADEDHDQRFLLTRLLQRAGFDVEAVATGDELVSLARTRQPAAIVLDVQRSEQDGYATGRRLKDDPATTAIPVMFLSGLSEAGEGTRPRAAGGADHASTSIDPVELIDRVRALCARIRPSSG